LLDSDGDIWLWSITNGVFLFHPPGNSIKQFNENFWTTVGDLKCLYNSKYRFSPARIETESIFIASDGNTETKKAIDYIYSLNETEAMLSSSGLGVKETWSIPGKKKFTLGEPRIYIIAEKITI